MIQEIDILLMGYKKCSVKSQSHITFPEGVRFFYIKDHVVIFSNKKQQWFMACGTDFIQISKSDLLMKKSA